MVMFKSTPRMRQKEPGKGLGTGLGRLLNGDKVAGGARGAQEIPRFGRGMETLLSAHEESAKKEQSRKALLPAWFFFTTDLLLLAFTTAILFDAPRPLPTGDVALAGVLIAFACLIGLTGVAVASSESDD